MSKFDRRGFLKTMGTGAIAASLPLSIGKALAIPAHNKHRNIQDVEHIVILTQENRSFDHYFGTMRGVRGFSDPRAVTLTSGKSVFHQPYGAGELLPFRPDVANMGATFLPDVPHNWNDTHGAWNGGQHDRWVANKGITAFTYHKRSDLPYHYSLADAFTICDAYHCSVMGPTDPNRYHLWTGWLGNNGAGDGSPTGPILNNAEAGYDWSSFPELLEKAGVSWKIYQDIGDGLDGLNNWGWTGLAPFIGNYGDNALLYLHQYQNALPGNPLADKAKTGTAIKALGQNPDRLFDILKADVAAGNLPQVSWIVGPEAYTEHPNWAPQLGAWYMSQIVDILASNPALFSKTVLLINWDEEGGFFDHNVPPTPPTSSATGQSTVPTTYEVFPGSATHVAGPIGLGMRVPMIVVSPWSKGGYVNSQVFDHTSVIKFIESRFGNGLFETNITQWRRAVTGDLTTAFNFDDPNAQTHFSLPNTTSYKPASFVRSPDFTVVVPALQTLPTQEPGVRFARALPYELNAHGLLQSDGNFRIDFSNTGTAAVVFQVRSGGGAHLPRTYTIEPGKTLSDVWLLGSIGLANCDLSVYGPNGFFRQFKGSVSDLRGGQLDVRATYSDEGGSISLAIVSSSSNKRTVSVLNQYTGKTTTLKLQGNGGRKNWSLERLGGWYDFVITVDTDPSISYHLAGHVENGEDSINDPGLGGVNMSGQGEDD